MSDCIDTVTSLMPSSSSFDGSDVQEILDHTVGPWFDDYEVKVEEMLDAPYLTEASGEYLDLLHGRLYSIERNSGESDDSYRLRMVFQCKDALTVQGLRDIGCRVYALPDVQSFHESSVLTSRNTSLNVKYVIDCPSDDIESLVKLNLPPDWSGWVVFV
jgi:hypothetical protein